MISVAIKQHINTPVVHPLVFLSPKHVLVSHHAHSVVVNVQPNFCITAVSILVKNVDRIVSAACRLAVMIEYTMKLVLHRLRRFPGDGCHDFWTDRDMRGSKPSPAQEKDIPKGISSSGPN